MSAEVKETADLETVGLDKKETPCGLITSADTSPLPNANLKITIVVKPLDEEQQPRRVTNQDDDLKFPKNFKAAGGYGFFDSVEKGLKSVPRQEEPNVLCCDDKYMFFMSVRTASLMFAWIGVVVSGLGTVGCFIANMVFTIFLASYRFYNINFAVSNYVLTSGLLFYFSTGFIASVILLIGIIKRKPILIKGYIIYAVVLTVLYVIMFIVLEVATYSDVFITIFMILGGFVYWAILYLHYLTFKEYVNASDTNGHVFPPEEAKENLTRYRADVLDVQPC